MKDKYGNYTFIKVCLDTKGFNHKPEQYELGGISNRTVGNQTEISIGELAKKVTLGYAKSWTPAIFTVSKHNRNGEWGLWRQNQGWNEQQLFALDIDDDKDGNPKIYFKSALDRCKRLNVKPIFAYNTFSDTGSDVSSYHRYRMVFMLPEPIRDVRIRNLVQISLMKIFPEADGQCKHASAIFHGGQSIIYKEFGARIDIHSVIHSAGIYLKENDPTNYAKNFQRYCNEIGLNSIKNTPDIKVEELIYKDLPDKSFITLDPHIEDSTNSCNKLYIYYRLLHEFVQKYTITLGEIFDSKSHKILKSRKLSNVKPTSERNNLPVIDFNEIANKCKLYKEFITGNYWAYHKELMGLATNLLCIRGGENKFFEGMSSRNEYGDKVNEFKYYVNYFKQQNYNPIRCETYCPHHEACKHNKNILTTVKIFKNKIIQNKEYKTISLEEGEVELEKAFRNALSSEDKKIHIIKSPTGSGKTELFLNTKDTIIAVPTHQLKNEISGRMMVKRIEHKTTPQMPEIDNDKLKQEIELLYSIGAYSSASLLIRKISEKGIFPEVEQYIHNLDASFKSNITTITTHQRMLYYNNSKLKTMIIDEDPLTSLLKISEVNAVDLLHFLSYLQREDPDNAKTGKDLYETIMESPINKFNKMDCYNWIGINKHEKNYSEWLIKQKMKTNILGFLYCAYFVKDEIDGKEVIHFIQKRDLPDKKIIILSATANENIYKKLYGDRVVFHDIGNVELKGKLIQYPEYSFSRYSLNKDESRLQLIQGLVKDKPVITFKSFQDKFENVVGTYGSLQGLDVLSGQDISIVGTPHIDQISYGLYALALGHDITYADMKMEYAPVEHNGFQFYFQTFSENSFLKEIQFYFIESELVQAIGRSRLLRNDGTVTLYSNYPIQGAEFRYLEEEEKDSILKPHDKLIA